LTLIGIIPGHWLLGADFTATSMIGFIALAGIIVRNSILLVDFAKGRVAEGMSVREAVVMAAEVRMRPIVITALALVIGSMVLLSDPIFQGMAVSLLFGSIVATFLTLVVIPLGCFSARKAFNCEDGDGGECPPAAPTPSEPSGDGPSSGGGGGRPPRLARQGEPGEGSTDSAMSSGSAPSGGRPPKLARKTETESAAVLATAAASVAGGRPPRLAKKTDEEPAPAAPAATGGRPPRLQKQADAAETPAAAQTGGRPPRLAKATEQVPVSAAPAVAGGRPPRLVKQAEVELPEVEEAAPPPVAVSRPAKPARKPVVVEAPVAPSARPPRAVKPATPQAMVVTPPPEPEPEPEIEAIEEKATVSARPARAKKTPEPPPVPATLPVVEAPGAVLADTVAKRPDEQQAPGKRKLRGIRIKMNDDGSGER
jgi:hypothetical protein